MKPIDYRNANFEEILEGLTESCQEVWEAWRKHGPGTTREIAEKSGIDLLTLRPRTTDLFQVGFVVLVDTAKKSRQGQYRAASEAEALADFRRRQAALTSGQLQLL